MTATLGEIVLDTDVFLSHGLVVPKQVGLVSVKLFLQFLNLLIYTCRHKFKLCL